MFSNEIIFVVEEIAPTVAKDIIEDFFIHFDKKKKNSKSKFSAKSSYLLSGMYAIQIFRPNHLLYTISLKADLRQDII